MQEKKRVSVVGYKPQLISTIVDVSIGPFPYIGYKPQLISTIVDSLPFLSWL